MAKQKDEARKADVSRQAEEVRQIGNQFLAQLVPGSEEYTQLQNEVLRLISTVESPADEQALARELGQRLATQQQQRISSGGPATPLEARTQAALEQQRQAAQPTPIEQDVLNVLGGQSTTTPTGEAFSAILRDLLQPTATPTRPEFQFSELPETGELDAISQALLGQESPTPLGGVASKIVGQAQTPEDFFTPALNENLQLAEDYINNQFARRGMLGSGLQIEGMGRAGVELAIQEADRKQQARRQAQQDAYGNLNALLGQRQPLAAERERGQERQFSESFSARQQVGSEANRQFDEQQQRLQNVEGLYGLGQDVRNRQLGIDQQATALQSGRERTLTSSLGGEASHRLDTLDDLLATRTANSEANALRARQEEAERNARIGRTVGNVAAAGANFIPGAGPFLSIGIREGVKEAFPSATGTGADQGLQGLEGLFAKKRANPGDLASALRKQTPGYGTLSAEDFAELLRSIQ